MTAIAASRASRVSTTMWERTLLATSLRLERAAVHHMQHRLSAADHDARVRALGEQQRDVHAAAALRIYGR